MKSKSNTIYLKCLALTLLLCFFGIFVCSAAVGADNAENIGRLSRLVTSNNPDNYSVIDVSGDKISFRGKYTGDLPYDVRVLGVEASSYHFKIEGDGSYTAELECSPFESGLYNLWICFNSRIVMEYLIMYDSGWFFPDNGLSIVNAQKLEKIREAEPIAAAYYISPTGDKAEIGETMEKIRTIANQVCENVDGDYQKAYLLNRWIADNIYYDHDAAETEVTIETVALSNVLTDHRTTCAGFANLFCALLEAEGIRSVNLKGAAAAGDITYETLTTGTENHEFSAFWYEEQNRWVYVDACWSGVGDYVDGEYTDGITYDKYFDITGEAFSFNHRIDKAEERFYTAALAAVEAQEATEILQTTAEGTAPSSETANTEQSGENSGGAQETSERQDGTVTAKTDGNPVSSNDSGNGGTVLYIIIGAAGIIAVTAGIILAVSKYKGKKQ